MSDIYSGQCVVSGDFPPLVSSAVCCVRGWRRPCSDESEARQQRRTWAVVMVRDGAGSTIVFVGRLAGTRERVVCVCVNVTISVNPLNSARTEYLPGIYRVRLHLAKTFHLHIIYYIIGLSGICSAPITKRT